MSAPAETYYRVGSSVWREFTDDGDRILALYLLTCDHRTTEGLFYMPLGYASTDLGWSLQKVRRHLGRLEAHGMVKYDADASVCLLVKALKWQAPQNPNGIKSALKKLATVPATPLRTEFDQLAERFCEPLAEALRNGSANGSPNGSGVVA